MGDDIYFVDDEQDQVVELPDEGDDTVITTLAAYALGDNVENLFYQGSEAFTGTGNSLANRIGGGDGDDALSGGDGDDIFIASLGSDEMDGGDGHDLLSLPGTRYAYAIGGYGPYGIEVTELGGNERHMILAAFEAIYFEEDDATYTLEDLFGYWGTEGDDLLEGSGFDNQLFGLGGDDVLLGHGGHDFLDGGEGADAMTGHDGHDIYYVDDSGDTVTEAAGDDGVDLVVTTLTSYTLGANIEMLVLEIDTDALDGTGNAEHNYLAGNQNDNRLEGLDGDDQFDGGWGDDTMIGGAGDDVYYVGEAGDVVTETAGNGTDQVLTTLASYALALNVERLTGELDTGQTLSGNALANLIWAGGGNDLIAGGDGADELLGNGGNDEILGGSGVDALTGGAGADLFRYGGWESVLGASDTITDFVSSEDRIDLSGIDADFSAGGDQAFTFIGGDQFSGMAGELRYSFNGTDTYIKGDTDGDGGADLVIILSGELVPLASDFIL